MKDKTRASERGFGATKGIFRRLTSPASRRFFARMLTVTSIFLLMILINLASALAYVQSHNLSEVRRVDTNLDMNNYNINNASLFRLGTSTHNQLAISSSGGVPPNTLYWGNRDISSNYEGCTNCISSTEVAFNYAASGSKGGAATDVSCTNCITLGSETSGSYDSIADTIADDGIISGTEIDTNTVQARVSGSCVAGQSIRAISTTGSVTCEVDDSVSGGFTDKVAYWTGATTLSYNTNFHWDNTNGRLGIGTTGPASTLSVGANGVSGAGIYGTGTSYGIYGDGSSLGVYGIVSGNYGYLGGSSGYGVYGAGSTVGVVGDRGGAGSVDSGYGVFGTGATGGVRGEFADNTYGVLGISGYGVFGTSPTYGVWGQYDSNNYGYLGASNMGSYGVGQYDNDLLGGYVIPNYVYGGYGRSRNTSGLYNMGLAGGAENNDYNYGVFGYAPAGANENVGVLGALGGATPPITGGDYAVYGYLSNDNYGYLGGSGVGVFGKGSTYGGEFEGHVLVEGPSGFDAAGESAQLLMGNYTSSLIAMAGAGGGSTLYVRGQDNITFRTGALGTDRMYIHNDGNVGIGNNFKALSKLAVNGPGVANTIVYGRYDSNTYGWLAGIDSGADNLLHGAYGQYDGDTYGFLGGASQGVGGVGEVGVLGGIGYVASAALNYGAYGLAYNSSNTGNYGLVGGATLGSTTNVGVFGYNDPAVTAPSGKYAVYGKYDDGDYGYLGGNSVGVYGAATGSGTVNYGIISTASGATTNWGIYTDADVGMVDNTMLRVPDAGVSLGTPTGFIRGSGTSNSSSFLNGVAIYDPLWVTGIFKTDGAATFNSNLDLTDGILAVYAAGAGNTPTYATLTGDLYVEYDIEADANIYGAGFIDMNGFPASATERLCWDGGGYSPIYDCAGSPGDYAEWYRTVEGETLEVGDIVVVVHEEDDEFDRNFAVSRSKEKMQGSILGVVSTEPNEIIGEDVMPEDAPHWNTSIFTYEGKQYVAITITGRVPVKATASNGAISVGDLLTTSDKPGYAMKLNEWESGPVIGKAIETLETGEGLVRVHFEPGHYTAPKDKEIADLTAKLDQLTSIVCLDHPEADICKTE